MKNKSTLRRIFAIMIILLIILGMVGSLLQSARPVSDNTQKEEEVTKPEETETYETIEAGIASISKYGNIILTVSPETMTEYGYEIADLITVKAGGISVDMPIGTAYSDVDSNQAVCTYREADEENPSMVIMAVNMGNMAGVLNIAEKHEIEESPGYEWTYINGFDENSSIEISMSKKQGYAEEYMIHQATSRRTDVREDYANLSDEEFANFRAVEMGEIAAGTLYRSSSPVDPSIHRNKEADDAALKAQITTVVNMADHVDDMKAYEGYSKTYYSECDIIALNMGMDIHEASYSEKLAEGFRYIAEHDGPYLIHCKEGKDRTGFAIAILECLMGASCDEIVTDYMKTYVNFYGVKEDSEEYEAIAKRNIITTLQNVFGINDLYDTDNDLKQNAEVYLVSIGMSKDEIEALREHLSAPYGGMDLEN